MRTLRLVLMAVAAPVLAVSLSGCVVVPARHLHGGGYYSEPAYGYGDGYGAPPAVGLVWIEGYWDVRGGRRNWVDGHWGPRRGGGRGR